MHNNCKCTVAPITANNDPGLKLNREDLDAIYRKAGSTSAADLKSVRVIMESHSEIGPILTQSQWRREYDDGTPAPEWHIPDLNMTRTALQRMYARLWSSNSIIRKCWIRARKTFFHSRVESTASGLRCI